MGKSIENLKAALSDVFVRRGSVPSGALATWASSEGRFLAGVVRFLDARGKPRPPRDYGGLQLEEKWLPMKRALDVLQATITGTKGKSRLPFGPFLASHWLERRTPDFFDNDTGWPEWTVTARVSESVQAPAGPAVAHGLPPFSSYGRAIEDWTLGETGRGGGEARNMRELRIVVPDTRGSLQSVRWTGSRLSGTIHTAGKHSELELQVIVDTERGSHALPSLHPVPSAFAWDTPKDARFAELFLVHSSRDLMGYARMSPGAEVTAEARALTLKEQAHKDLTDWESENVEFKPFIERRDTKESEVVASAIAFANTNGGRIYIGVGNDREPEGDQALKKVLKSGETGALADYMRHLDELIRERVKPVPFFRVESVHLLSRQAIVIVVEPGREKPYATVPGNDVFIRSGASNRRPDPRTELQALYNRTNASLS